MQGIDYTRGHLFTKKRRKRITDVRVLADREERNVVTPVINPSGTISFSFNFDGNDPIILRKRVKITQTKLRLTPKSPRKGVNYYELNYGTECIRCGRTLPDLSVLNRKKEPEELCKGCKKLFPPKPTISRLMFIDNTGGVSKIVNVIDKNKPLVFKRKKREEVKKWYGSLKAIAQEEHNSYTDWVRRKGYTESINIVRRT
ncbi:Hypothetical protein PORT_53 [Enterococcus phage Porthos]|uniref:Uncharacterized protein n=2 Tax=Enterococcus phage Porthos TaxID=2795670 RepID=A0ACB0DNT5_9CAUD|nr:Hypothetical protein PORT_53 [Enterococcus phage Porthos]